VAADHPLAARGKIDAGVVQIGWGKKWPPTRIAGSVAVGTQPERAEAAGNPLHCRSFVR
jgi:hypothetical protein